MKPHNHTIIMTDDTDIANNREASDQASGKLMQRSVITDELAIWIARNRITKAGKFKPIEELIKSLKEEHPDIMSPSMRLDRFTVAAAFQRAFRQELVSIRPTDRALQPETDRDLEDRLQTQYYRLKAVVIKNVPGQTDDEVHRNLGRKMANI